MPTLPLPEASPRWLAAWLEGRGGSAQRADGPLPTATGAACRLPGLRRAGARACVETLQVVEHGVHALARTGPVGWQVQCPGAGERERKKKE